MNQRVDQLRRAMAADGIDSFLATGAATRRYLSGFTGSDGALLVTPAQGWLITDFRYTEQAGAQAPGWQIHRRTGWLHDALAPLLEEGGGGRLAFEADQMTVADFERLKSGSPDGIEWVATQQMVMALRAVKDADELAAIRAAQAITDQVGAALPTLIEVGRNERQIAWAIEKQMRDLGADGPAFEIIVACGANAALPHHRPTERVVGADEIVLVDMGARLNGYHSDMTRTFFTGAPPPNYVAIYETVRAAKERAKEVIAPGVPGQAVDAAARTLIADAGHGEHFGHGLGHGVGLEIHEAPRLGTSESAKPPLAAGHVVTVEPGIYLPGWGGVRIEDLVHVTARGAETLTTTGQEIDAWRQARRA